MKVLSDILHKAGVLKENAEAYSSGGYSVLVRNSTTQRLETVPSSSLVPDQSGNAGKYLTTDGANLSWGTVSTANIYNSDGTLTGNRTVTSGGFNLTFTGSNTASAAIARGLNLTHTLVAAANNDVLVGLDINPTFTNGAFTGVNNIAAFVRNGKLVLNQSTAGISSGDLEIKDGGRYSPIVVVNNFTSFRGVAAFGNGAPHIILATGGGGAPSPLTNKSLLMAIGGQDILITQGIAAQPSASDVTMQLFGSTRNITIGGTTDAGYKLDVNGTARVQNRLNLTHDIYFLNNNTDGIVITGANVVYPKIIVGSENTVSGNTNLVFGKANTSTGLGFVFGTSNTANSNTSMIFGTANQANTSGQYTILIGGNNVTSHAVTTFTGTFAIGNANSLDHQASSIIGSNQNTTANNQLIIASSQSNVNSAGYNDIYFGTGPRSKNTNLLGSSITINGSGAGAGTDLSGGNVTIAGGKGTGTGTPGDVIFSTSTATTTGTTIQSLTQRVWIKGSTGNVGIGNNNPSQKLAVSGNAQVTHSYAHTTGSFTSGFTSYVIATTALSPSYTSGMFYGATNTFYQNEFEGSATVPNSVIMSSQLNVSRVRFVNTNSTITMTQSGSGIRAIANQILQFQLENAQTSCVVSHVAGSQILAPYYIGSNTPTITNYYGLALNPSDEYSATLAVTNRWGVYQAGASDNNYFAGKVLIGTNTVGTYALDVSGTSRLTGAVTIDAGSVFGSYIAYKASSTTTWVGTQAAAAQWVNGGSIGDYIIRREFPSANSYIFYSIGGLGWAGYRYSFTTGSAIYKDNGTTFTTYDSSIFSLDSISRGFLPPRMTGAQVEAISSPAEGLLAYATNAGSGAVTSKGWWGYDGSTWVKLN